MVSFENGKFGIARRLVAGLLLGGATLAATGCSLIPTRDDIRTATTTVKDTVTGKAKRDKENQTYAEARIFERRKDYAAAERLYRELLVARPESRDCYHRLGVMSAVQGKYAEAQQHYQSALACSEPTPDLLSDIGYCHYLQQQLPQAESALRAAVAMQPQHSAALNNLALVIGEQGNLDEAYDLFRRANTEAEAECNFGYLCAQTGDLPSAQVHFSRALSVNPDMRPAAEALLQVTQSMQRRQDEARASLEKLAAQAAAQQTNPQLAGEQLPGNAVQQASGQRPLAPQHMVQQASATSQLPYQQGGVAPAGATFAGGYNQAVAAQNGGVQLASGVADPGVATRAANALAAVPPQRLIEVYRGSPRTAAGSAQIAAASNHRGQQAAPDATATQPANPIANHQTPAGGGWSNGMPNNPTPVNTVQPVGMQAAASTPYSFPSSQSPQYLQPSLNSRMKSPGGPGATESQGTPSQGSAVPSAPVRQNGVSFPPLGG